MYMYIYFKIGCDWLTDIDKKCVLRWWPFISKPERMDLVIDSQYMRDELTSVSSALLVYCIGYTENIRLGFLRESAHYI